MNLNSVHFKFVYFLTSGIEQGSEGENAANFRACACVFDGSEKFSLILVAETIIYLLGRSFTVPGIIVHNMRTTATTVQKEKTAIENDGLGCIFHAPSRRCHSHILDTRVCMFWPLSLVITFRRCLLYSRFAYT